MGRLESTAWAEKSLSFASCNWQNKRGEIEWVEPRKCSNTRDMTMLHSDSICFPAWPGRVGIVNSVSCQHRHGSLCSGIGSRAPCQPAPSSNTPAGGPASPPCPAPGRKHCTATVLRQANGTVPRQRLIPDFSAIEAPAGVCRCAATGSVFSMQGSIGRPSTKIWATGSPILASPISMTSSSPKYNTLPHLLPSWPLSLSRSSALHFGSPSFHISQEDSDQLACSVP